ncbi:type VII toxin-antitoxin system MntA family adenylyltransferase antitoxin [Halorussus halophilus]|uniref:type VII toxin-antitoxin system MntA family adenylyltransferase antitoxin n=1 Tax=Halorussus halophilus TaxID=2650975 RepID=UPI001300FDE2|nr:nucleotidyltransferase domain-containing protein [Halorussus halophilus]
MRTVETAGFSKGFPVERLQRVLRDHPVQLALLFGSHATATTHSQSDVDIAVEFDSAEPDDSKYNDMFFALSAELSEALETDQIDLVDLHTASPDVVASVFEHGILLVGDPEHAENLQHSLTPTSKSQSPRERFDAALAKIDQHLSGDSAVSAVEGSNKER